MWFGTVISGQGTIELTLSVSLLSYLMFSLLTTESNKESRSSTSLPRVFMIARYLAITQHFLGSNIFGVNKTLKKKKVGTKHFEGPTECMHLWEISYQLPEAGKQGYILYRVQCVFRKSSITTTVTNEGLVGGWWS